MPIVVKRDDVRSGRKAEAQHVTGGSGVNRLSLVHFRATDLKREEINLLYSSFELHVSESSIP